MSTRRKHSKSRIRLKIRDIRGSFAWRDHELQLRWSITIDDEGRAAITFAPVKLTKKTAWMLNILGGNELFGEWARINGSTLDGVIVSSEHVYIGSRGESDRTRGTFLALAGEAIRLTISRQALPVTNAGLRLVYGTVGMEGISAQRIDTSVGRVSVAGATTVKNYDTLVGWLEVTAPARATKLERWVDRSDLMAERVLDMVSLAEGRLIRWSVRHIARGKQILVSEFHGPQRTGPPQDGAGHFLNLQPFVDLAVHRYTWRLRRRTGFQVALQWFLSHPAYSEQQLLTAMTALEHLVATYVAQRRAPKIISQRTFKALKLVLTNALDNFANEPRRRSNRVLQQRLQRIRAKVASLNDAPFRDKLLAMLATYRVPLLGIDALIPAAITHAIPLCIAVCTLTNLAHTSNSCGMFLYSVNC
jgi:hypothetical protein